MSVIYPMGMLAIFTLLYSGVVIKSRIRAVKEADIKGGYFKTFLGETPPDYMQKPTRQWANLYELPVLFYVVCITLLVLKLDDPLYAQMAYAFVGFRLIQAFIHTTYNNVNHRLLAFFLGLLTVAAMWIRLLYSL